MIKISKYMGLFFLSVCLIPGTVLSQTNAKTDEEQKLVSDAIKIFEATKAANKIDSALLRFENLETSFPNNDKVHTYVGLIKFIQMENTKAFWSKPKFGNVASKEFKIAISINDSNYTAHYYLGRMYHQCPLWYSDMRKDAIREFERAVQLEPKNAVSMVYLAEAYEKNKQKDLALTMYNEALLLDPNNKEVQSKIEKLK